VHRYEAIIRSNATVMPSTAEKSKRLPAQCDSVSAETEKNHDKAEYAVCVFQQTEVYTYTVQLSDGR
jgi:hypothetical protein